MHRRDDSIAELTEAIVEYALWRVAPRPAAARRPAHAAELRAAAGPTITPDGIGGLAALRVFADVLAPACISVDHPRFLSFVPAAPTEAAILFDLVVGASSIYGGSWLEGGGAIYAENEALRWIADLAGLPADGRRRVRQRRHGRQPERPDRRPLALARPRRRRATTARAACCVASGGAHSSVASAARAMDADVVVVPADAAGPPRRRVPSTPRSAGSPPTTASGCSPSSPRPARRTPASSTTSPRRPPACAAELGHVDARRRGLRRGRARRAERPRTGSPASRPPTASSSTRTSGCSRRSTRAPCCTATRRSAAAPTPSTPSTSTSCTPTTATATAVERVRLRPPPVAPGPRPAAVVQPGDPRHRRLRRGDRDDAAGRPRGRRPGRAPRRTSSCSSSPSCRSCCSAASAGTPPRYQAWSDEQLAAEQSFVTPTAWHGETVLRWCIVNPLTTVDDLAAHRRQPREDRSMADLRRSRNARLRRDDGRRARELAGGWVADHRRARRRRRHRAGAAGDDDDRRHRLPRHAGPDQHPPPPVPEPHPGLPADDGQAAVRLAAVAVPAVARRSTRRRRTCRRGSGWPSWRCRAARRRPTTSTCTRTAPATCSPPRSRPPATSASASTRRAARCRCRRRTAACRPTTSSPTTTTSSPPARRRCRRHHDRAHGAMVRIALAPCSPFTRHRVADGALGRARRAARRAPAHPLRRERRGRRVLGGDVRLPPDRVPRAHRLADRPGVARPLRDARPRRGPSPRARPASASPTARRAT